MEKTRVLVVDDSEEVTELVVAVLSTSGYDARAAATGGDALNIAAEWEPEVVILDLTLPDIDGIEVCRQLRTFSSAYVLMLSARSDEVDRIVGLTVGADDYVTKPFSPRELTARVGALMRRKRMDPPKETVDSDAKRQFGPFVVDPQTREVCFGDRALELTKIEFDIIDALTEQPKRVVSREQLRERVWGAPWLGEDHAVDVHLSNLRRKLADAGAPTIIMTARGVGYRLSPQLLDESS